METAIDGLAERGARVIVIADRDDVLAARRRRRCGSSPGVPEWLSPLDDGDPGPARGRSGSRSSNGSDLDSPHGLSKITLTL